MPKPAIGYIVTLEDGYLRVHHTRRGLIAAGVWRNGKLSDIHVEERYRKVNPIRMPAMIALQKWIEKQGGNGNV